MEGRHVPGHWLPVLAFYDDEGWQPTPFIPWHQPFFNEAGVYTARVTLPCDQKLACTGAVIAARHDLGDGWQQIDDRAVRRARLRLPVQRPLSRSSPAERRPASEVRVPGLPGARVLRPRTWSRSPCEAIPVYSQLVRAVPLPGVHHRRVVLRLERQRVLRPGDDRRARLRHAAHRRGYVEYLVSHEICHQWWYNVVGTNGYCETWMDEGLATYFTHRFMTSKYGKNNSADRLSRGPGLAAEHPPRGLPHYGTVRHHRPRRERRRRAGRCRSSATSSTCSACATTGQQDRRHDRGPARRGGVPRLHALHLPQVLLPHPARRRLPPRAGGVHRPVVGGVLQHWLYGKGTADWSVDKVNIEDITENPSYWDKWKRLWHRGVTPAPCKVRVILHQKAEYTEQTVVGFSFDGNQNCHVRVPILPQVAHLEMEDPPATVTWLCENRVQVDVVLPCRPTQIAVDPDQVLFDSEPANNYWKTRCRYRFTPLYTLLDENDITSAYDRRNVTFGPWLYATAYDEQWYTRSVMAGVRAGIYRTQQYNGGVYAAYRSDYRDIAIGIDGLWDHWPYTRTQIGFNAERSLIGMEDDHYNNRGVIFGRYIFQYGSSLYLPSIEYAEIFGAIENNELPIPRYQPAGSNQLNNMTLAGAHYRIDYLTPYWDPEGGFRFDVTVAGGIPDVGQSEEFCRASAQFSMVKGLPDGLGWLSETRLAARVYGAAGWPNDNLYFTLGGAGLFRAFDMAERQGSSVWLGSVEWRIPLLKHLRKDCLDHTVGLRGVSAVVFYDVGNSYVLGDQLGPIAHGVGGGIYFDVAWFSFVERTTIRFDVAKSLNVNAPTQFNFYFQHPF